MKKQLWSALLALTLCLTLLPGATIALDAESQDGTRATAESTLDADVAAVQALLDALPTPEDATAADYDAAQEACDAYEALTDEQRAQVTGAENLASLLAYFADGIEPADGEDEGDTPAAHTHYICGGDSCTGVGHTCTEKVTFVEWTDELAAQQYSNRVNTDASNSLPIREGNYYLTKDVTLLGIYTFEGQVTVNLCLNGHTIKWSQSYLRSGNKLMEIKTYRKPYSLTDCRGTGKLDASTGTDGGTYGVSVSNGVFNFYAGTIQNALSGGVSMIGGTMNMYGGKITGCGKQEYSGGGVSMISSCELNMYGGEISGNTAKQGGGIYARNATVHLYGGKVTGNTSDNGGGIYLDEKGFLTLHDSANVTGNTQKTDMSKKSNIFLTKGRYVSMADGYTGTAGLSFAGDFIPEDEDPQAVEPPTGKTVDRTHFPLDELVGWVLSNDGKLSYCSHGDGYMGADGECACGETYYARNLGNDNIIAMIENQGNGALSNAFADVLTNGGGTITLLRGSDESKKLLDNCNSDITINKAVVLDLNGISVEGTGTLSVVAGGKLTIQNSAATAATSRLTIQVSGGELIVPTAPTGGTAVTFGTKEISGTTYGQISAAAGVSGSKVAIADGTFQSVKIDGGAAALSGGTYTQLEVASTVSSVLAADCGYYSASVSPKVWTAENFTGTKQNITVAKLPLTNVTPTDENTPLSKTYGDNLKLNVDFTKNSTQEATIVWKQRRGDSESTVTDILLSNGNKTLTVERFELGSVTYTCTITCDGYAVTRTFDVTVNKKPLSDCTVTVEPIEYAGQDFDISGYIKIEDDDVKLTFKMDYEKAGDANSKYTAIDAGTYKAKFKACENSGYSGEIEVEWKITPCPYGMPEVTVADKKWDGKSNATPAIQFKALDGTNRYVGGENYTVTATYESTDVSDSVSVNWSIELKNKNLTFMVDGKSVSKVSGTTTAKITKANAPRNLSLDFNVPEDGSFGTKFSLNQISGVPTGDYVTGITKDAEFTGMVDYTVTCDVSNGHVTDAYFTADGIDLNENTITFKFVVSFKNHEDAKLVVYVYSKDSDHVPVVTLSSTTISKTYDGESVSVPVPTGTATMGGEPVEVTCRWMNNLAPKNVYDSGVWYVDVSPESANGNAVHVPVTVTITPVKLSGTPTFGAHETDDTLEDVAVTCPDSWPEGGAFFWVDGEGNALDGTTVVEQGKQYAWQFTSADGNYASSGSAVLWQKSGSNGSGGSGSSASATAPTVKPSEGGTASVDKKNPAVGESVTVTPRPDAGYAVGEIRVTDKNGETVPVTKNADGSYSYTQPEGGVTIEVIYVAANATGFGDVPATAWYAKAVAYVRANGWMDGVGANEFAPKATVGREQFVTVLYRMAGSPAVSGSANFADVARGKYYSDAIAWALGEGIVDGIGGDMFGVGGAITREQMAVMVYRYVCAQGGGFTDAWAYQLTFTDLANVSDWALEAVAWCNMHGILTGRDDGSFDPQGTATRAEMAQLVMNWQMQGETA